MKTQAKRKLTFEKGTITELNDASLSQINGGTAYDTNRSVRPTSFNMMIDLVD